MREQSTEPDIPKRQHLGQVLLVAAEVRKLVCRGTLNLHSVCKLVGAYCYKKTEGMSEAKEDQAS